MSEDVKADYSAVGDGVTDDTVAIQAALDGIPNEETLTFPTGTYVVTDLTMTSKTNVRLEGEGYGRAGSGVKIRIAGTGDTTKNVLDISASSSIEISNIGFFGNNDNNASNKSNIGLYIHRGAGYTSDIKVTNCTFRYLAVGAHIGGLGGNESNNENMHFYGCEFQQCTTGYRQYWPNSLQNSHTDCYYLNNDYNIWLGSAGVQTGSLVVRNANFAVTTNSDIYFEAPASLAVYSFRSENAAQFISTSGFASTAFPSFLLVDGVIISKTTFNTPVIDCRVSGFTAINVQFGQYTETAYTIFASYYVSAVTLIGCKFNSLLTYGISDLPTSSYVLSGGNGAGAGLGQYSLIGCSEWEGSYYEPVPDRKHVHSIIASAAGTGAMPYVTHGDYLILSNDGPTTVTDFLGGLDGTEITVTIGSNTTIANNSNIAFKSASSVTSGSYKFVYYSGTWREL